MGSIKRRLHALEGRVDPSAGATAQYERRVSQEVLRRMTFEELHSYDDVLKRAIERGEPLRALPEEEPTVRRVWEIYEGVESELAQTS